MRVTRINDSNGNGRPAAMLDRICTQSEVFLLVGVAFTPSINACKPASPQKSKHEAEAALSSKLYVIPPYISSYSRRTHANPSTLPSSMHPESNSYSSVGLARLAIKSSTLSRSTTVPQTSRWQQ